MKKLDVEYNLFCKWFSVLFFVLCCFFSVSLPTWSNFFLQTCRCWYSTNNVYFTETWVRERNTWNIRNVFRPKQFGSINSDEISNPGFVCYISFNLHYYCSHKRQDFISSATVLFIFTYFYCCWEWISAFEWKNIWRNKSTHN